MTEKKILLNAPGVLKDEFDKFVSKNPDVDAEVFTTDSFDGTQIVHLLLEYGPEALTAISLFIASLKAKSIEININLPGLGKSDDE